MTFLQFSPLDASFCKDLKALSKVPVEGGERSRVSWKRLDVGNDVDK